MGLITIILFHLWTQPSVRMLGFGEDFAGFIPDPITDLLRNPACLEDFGVGYEASYNSLQIHTIIQKFDELDSTYIDTTESHSFGTAEPLSVFLLYPKFGLGFRLGAFMRYGERNHSQLEPWLYRQDGFVGALNLSKYIKIGGEYNYSWNDTPDEYYVTVWDTLNNTYDAPIYRGQTSNEFGLGIIIGDNKIWQLAVSARRNLEKDSFEALFFPQEWQREWTERREEKFFFSRIEGNFHSYMIVVKCDYIGKTRVQRRYYFPEDSFNLKFSSFESGLAIQNQLDDYLMISVGIIYCTHEYTDYHTKGFIIPVGFERKVGSVLTFRFGNAFIYNHAETELNTTLRFDIKNEMNFGLEFQPYDKMCLYLATQDPLNYRRWFLGLSFAL